MRPGLSAAGTQGGLKSEVGLKGIACKVFIFFIVKPLRYQIDLILGNQHMIRDAGPLFFYVANELLSIIENGG
nr:phage holin family protein [Paenibacillus larvae]